MKISQNYEVKQTSNRLKEGYGVKLLFFNNGNNLVVLLK